MARRSELAENYRIAVEALHDALLAFGSRINMGDHKEYERLKKLVEKCQDNVDRARREFERGIVPEDMERSG